ncbi:MAG: hypothetical protein MUE86_00120 [Thiobacillaceae bacterium]|jgi:TolA-binding protein|nr:hypothetical protein [Thiobacillaceae bacterium]
MAIPWMWVLKTVPWSEVIANAPKLVDGARKLWGSVSKQASAPRQTDDGASTVPGSAPAEATLARLHERVGDLEANLEAVHGQILASSELIRSLADQNVQLVRHLEELRLRLRRLGLLALAAGVVAMAALAMSWGG